MWKRTFFQLERMYFFFTNGTTAMKASTQLKLIKVTAAKIVKNIQKQPGWTCELTWIFIHFIRRLIDADPRKKTLLMRSSVRVLKWLTISLGLDPNKHLRNVLKQKQKNNHPTREILKNICCWSGKTFQWLCECSEIYVVKTIHSNRK